MFEFGLVRMLRRVVSGRTFACLAILISLSISGCSGGGSGGDITSQDFDNDGVLNNIDVFPNNPLEAVDTDGDGIGNNADTDDDNDGVADVSDALPLNPNEQFDTDGDGVGDNSDPDIDGDGINNNLDTHPLNPDRWSLISATTSSISLTAVYGSSELVVQRSLQIVAPGIDWQVTSSSSWLSVSSDTGSGTFEIDVLADFNGLAFGVHSAQLTLIDADTLYEYKVDVDLSLVLPTMTVSQANLVYYGDYGWRGNVLTNAVSMNTGSNSYPVSVDVSFPLTNAVSGVVNNNVGSATEDVVITLNPDSIVAGDHPGIVTLTSDINGEMVTASFDISVLVGEHVIFVPDNGVALSSFPTGGKLSHNVKVLDSYASTTTPWAAVSSDPWLTVTASGVTGGEVTLVADPAGLSTNTIYFASVTVTSSLASVANSETIRVAFWVDAADPAQRTDVNIDYAYMVADPLRPYVYLNTGGNTLSIYNVYTGQLVTTESITTTSLGRMVASHDGSYLYVKDVTNNQLIRINLDNFAQKDTWASNAEIYEYSRPLGQPVLLTEAGYAMDADTGVKFALATPTFSFGTSEIDSSLHGNRFCMVNSGLTPSSVKCRNLGYSSKLHRLYISGATYLSSDFGKDIALNNDGSKVYVVASAFKRIGVIEMDSGITHYLIADTHPNSVDIGPDEELFGGVGDYNGPLAIWIYNVDDSLKMSAYLSQFVESIEDRGLVASGDGLMAIAITSASNLVFFRAY